jgi:hypothetical protein
MSSEELNDKQPSQLEKVADDDTDSSVYSITDQIAKEKDHPIQYRSCSWQKVREAVSKLMTIVLLMGCSQTTALLMSEYICLAILSFPW